MLNTSQGSPGRHLHSVDRFTSLNRKFHLFSIVVLPAASSKLELVERACVSPSSICHKDVRGIITTLKVMRAKFVKGGGRGGGLHSLYLFVSSGSPSCGGDVTVYVSDINQPGLLTPFYSVLVSILSLWPFQLYFIP